MHRTNRRVKKAATRPQRHGARPAQQERRDLVVAAFVDDDTVVIDEDDQTASHLALSIDPSLQRAQTQELDAECECEKPQEDGPPPLQDVPSTSERSPPSPPYNPAPPASAVKEATSSTLPPPVPDGAPPNICLVCGQAQKRTTHQFCSDVCTVRMDSFAAPQFLRVPANHELFAELQSRVAGTWKARSAAPRVAKVFLITWPKGMRRSFQDYRDAVARTRRIAAGRPTEYKCFAGDWRACRLGDAGVPSLCVNAHCALCRAVESGFASTLARNRDTMPAPSLPFGGGIYVSPNSSTAVDAAGDEEPGSPYTALLVTRTVLGEKLVLHREERGRDGVESGYDSVKGFTGGSKQVQFVLYDANAVRPAYLVMTEKK